MAAITFPLDLIESGVFWCRSFAPAYRQELSRVAGGTTIRRNLGRPLWRAEYGSKTLSANEISRIRARVHTLHGGIFPFMGYDPARCRPIEYPSKAEWFDDFDGTATVSQIYEDNRRLDISGLPAGYVVSTGDHLNVSAARLYMVARGATAGEDGVAVDIQIFPWFYPGVSAGNAVSLLRPFCNMAINPDETSEDVDIKTGRGTYSFTAWEVP